MWTFAQPELRMAEVFTQMPREFRRSSRMSPPRCRTILSCATIMPTPELSM